MSWQTLQTLRDKWNKFSTVYANLRAIHHREVTFFWLLRIWSFTAEAVYFWTEEKNRTNPSWSNIQTSKHTHIYMEILQGQWWENECAHSQSPSQFLYGRNNQSPSFTGQGQVILENALGCVLGKHKGLTWVIFADVILILTQNISYKINGNYSFILDLRAH